MFRKIKLFFKDITAIILLEYALTLPIFITMIIGTIETSNYMTVVQKVNTASQIGTALAGSLPAFKANTGTVLDAVGGLVESVIKDTTNSKAISNFGISFIFIQQLTSNPTPHMVYKHEFGTITSEFPSYKPNNGNNIDDTFINANRVSPDRISNYIFNSLEQIIVTEVSVTYNQFMGGMIDFNPEISFTTAPTVMRVNRIHFFAEGGKTNTI